MYTIHCTLFVSLLLYSPVILSAPTRPTSTEEKEEKRRKRRAVTVCPASSRRPSQVMTTTTTITGTKKFQTHNLLVTWLKDYGFWVVGNGDDGRRDSDGRRRRRPLTHVFLNGGKASVPHTHTDEFVRVYADAVRSGCPQYAVERTPPLFRMFMDIDLKSTTTSVCDGDEYGGDGDHHPGEMVIVKRILDVMSDLMRQQGRGRGREHETEEERPFVCLVCLKQDGGYGRKNNMGAHIVWEGTCVDGARAAALRESCVSACAAQVPSLDWRSIVDGAVYRNNGLRMVYSRKRNDDAYYVPRFVSYERGAMSEISDDDLVADLPNWIRRASVICRDEELPSLPPSSHPHSHFNPSLSETSAGRDAYPFHHHIINDDNDHEKNKMVSSSTQSSSSIDVTEESFTRALSGMMSLLPRPYDQCNIMGASTYTTMTRTRVKLTTNSRYCMNLGRDHNSNRVYFTCDVEGVFQHCFCNCDTSEGRKFGPCGVVKIPLLGPDNPLSVSLGSTDAVDAEVRRWEEAHDRERKKAEKRDASSYIHGGRLARRRTTAVSH